MNVPDGALGPTADPVNSGIVAGEMDAENVTVTGNTVYGNSAAGIIARRGSKHIVIANNTVYNNSQHVAGAFSS